MNETPNHTRFLRINGFYEPLPTRLKLLEWR